MHKRKGSTRKVVLSLVQTFELGEYEEEVRTGFRQFWNEMNENDSDLLLQIKLLINLRNQI
jgi:hypothetical protein